MNAYFLALLLSPSRRHAAHAEIAVGLLEGLADVISHRSAHRRNPLPQMRMKIPDSWRELATVRTHQVQRSILARLIRQQYLQSICFDIVMHIEPRLIGDAPPFDGPAPRDFSVVAKKHTLYCDLPPHAAGWERPAVVNTSTENVRQTVVQHQFIQRCRQATPLHVFRRGNKHPSVVFCERKRHVARRLWRPIANGDVYRVAKDIGHVVRQRKLQHQLWMRVAEHPEPRKQTVSTEIRRGSDSQSALKCMLCSMQTLTTLVNHRENLLGIGEVLLSFRGKFQTSRGTRKETGIQLALKPLDCGAYLSR